MATNPTTLTVKFSVHSPIYASVYAAIEEVNSRLKDHPWYGPETFTIDPKAGGDRAARNSVIGRFSRFDRGKGLKLTRSNEVEREPPEADVAVCDPMVLAEYALPLMMQGHADESLAQIVAFVLKRPGLYLSAPTWLASHLQSIASPNVDELLPDKYATFTHYQAENPLARRQSLVSRTRERSGRVPKIYTYENSTAAYLVEWLISQPLEIWKPESDPEYVPVDEIVRMLNAQTPPTPGNDPDADKELGASEAGEADPFAVVVCDAVVHQRLQQDGKKGFDAVPFSFARSEVIPDFPFTAIVASSQSLGDSKKRYALRMLVRELDRLGRLKQHKRIEALKYGKAVHKCLDCQQRTDDKDIAMTEAFIEKFFSANNHRNSYGRKMLVYPSGVMPNPSIPWIDKGWRFSWNELWRLPRFSSEIDPIDALRAISVMHLARRVPCWPAVLSARNLLWLAQRASLRSSALWHGLIAGLAVSFAVLFLNNWLKQKSYSLDEASFLYPLEHDFRSFMSSPNGAAILKMLDRDAVVIAVSILIVSIVIQPIRLALGDYRRSRGRSRYWMILMLRSPFFWAWSCVRHVIGKCSYSSTGDGGKEA